MAGLEAGARADLLVGEVIVEFEADELAAAGVESFKGQAHQADALHADQLLVGEGCGIGGIAGGGPALRGGGVHGNGFAGLTALVEGEVVDGAVKPAARFAHGLKVGLQVHKGFLNEVLRGAQLAGQAQGITEEGRFEGRKEFLNRFASGRCSSLVWLH